jgi:hypothetical protein
MVALLAVWLASAPMEVVGSGDCPAPAEVSRRLTEMLPTGAGDPTGRTAPHRARIVHTESGVHVELLLPNDEQIAARDLSADGSCDDLAAAVAVVIAAWEAELDPHLTARVDLPAPRIMTAPTVRAAATPASPPQSLSFEVGLALIASLAGGQLAPGAGVGGWIAPADWRLGLGLDLSGTTARSASVGSRADAARWTRFGLGLGPEAHLDVRGALVDLRAQSLVALLRVEGVGLSTTTSGSSTQLGAGAGVRVGWPWENVAPWIGADALIWPGHDSLVVGGLPAMGALPRFELQLSVGMSLGRFP